MDCLICADRGFVAFFIKKNDSQYEYFARCKCKKGKEIEGEGFAKFDDVFTVEELEHLKNKNKERYQMKVKKHEKNI